MSTRILNIMLAMGRGGVETMALQYHQAMRCEGFEVLSLGHPKGVIADSLPRPEFHPLTTVMHGDPVAAWQLRGIIRDFAPDIILTHGNRATALSAGVIAGGQGRTVQVLHNQCYKPHLKRVSAALCVSDNVKAGLRTAYPDVPAFEIPNFAPLRLHPVKPAPRTRPVIGAMGRLHEVKRFDLLLAAAAQLKAQGHDFLLRIAGDGPQRDALVRQARSLGLEGCIEFTGWASDPGAFMAGLDLFAVTSRYEGFGLVLIEAMAAGVPVVAADTEAPRQVLQDGRLGTLFESGNEGALAQALAGVMSDWTHPLRVARRAQSHALATFGFEAGRRRLRSAMAMLMDGPLSWRAAPEDAITMAAE